MNLISKLVIVSLVILAAFLFLRNFWILAASIGLGYLGAKMRERRLFGIALLMGLYFFMSNPLGGPSSVNQPQPPAPPVQQSVVQAPSPEQEQEVELVASQEVHDPDVTESASEEPEEAASEDENDSVSADVPVQPEFIDIGMRQDQVQRMVGEPEKIEGSGGNINWRYGIAWVSFDDNGRVTGWHNFGNRLADGMRQPVAGSLPFDIGSNREEVLRAVGAAEKIESRDSDRWYYGLAWITIDQNGQVSGWKYYREQFGDMVLE